MPIHHFKRVEVKFNEFRRFVLSSPMDGNIRFNYERNCTDPCNYDGSLRKIAFFEFTVILTHSAKLIKHSYIVSASHDENEGTLIKKYTNWYNKIVNPHPACLP